MPEHLIRPKTIAVDTRIEVDYTTLKGGDVAPATVCGVNGDGSYVVVLDAKPRAAPATVVPVTMPRGTRSSGTFTHALGGVERTLRCPLDAKPGSVIYVDANVPASVFTELLLTRVCDLVASDHRHQQPGAVLTRFLDNSWHRISHKHCHLNSFSDNTRSINILFLLTNDINVKFLGAAKV